MNAPNVIRLSPRETALSVLSASIALLTIGLLFVGALVTGTGSGLSVPDWPTTFGQNMFTYPLREMTGGVVYEHSHRLFASGVGLLMVFLVLGTLAWETRKWTRGLALAALALVGVQGILGGVTVLYKLPVAVSSAHGTTAVLFFCTLLWLTWAFSPFWKNRAAWNFTPLSRAALLLTGLALLQTLVGAVARHSHAGLAIPTFPLAFGEWLPPHWSGGILLNFLHTRAVPLLLISGCLALCIPLMRAGGNERVWGTALLLMVSFQALLGMLAVWSVRNVWVTSLHLVMGALLTGTLFSLVLWCGKAGVRKRLVGESP